MALHDPPEREVLRAEKLEPFLAALDEAPVNGLVRELVEGFRRLPDRHVHDDRGIFVSRDLCGVAAFVLEPPDKAGTLFGECVDAIEIVDELGDARVVDRMEETADVDLGEVHGGFRAGERVAPET